MISFRPLKNYLKNKGKNLTWLSNGLGYQSGILAIMLNNGTSVELLYKICSFLNCSISDVICYEKDDRFNKRFNVNWDKITELYSDSLSELARTVGLDRNTLTASKRNGGKIKFEYLEKISCTIGCSVEELINE